MPSKSMSDVIGALGRRVVVITGGSDSAGDIAVTIDRITKKPIDDFAEGLPIAA